MQSVPDKRSLHGLDIIVSYRQATEERSDNLYAVLRHLDRTYSDYQLWLLEGDEAPHFDWPLLRDSKIRHVFVPSTGPFPKALLYNTGARLARSPIVCFHDADCIARPEYLVYCIERMLSQEGSDVLWTGLHAMCPFQSMINISGPLKKSFIETVDFGVFSAMTEGEPELPEMPPDANLLYRYNVGGIFLFRRKIFMQLGGLNPSCTGWGSEDNELFARASRLGVNWQVLSKPMFHLHHDSTSRDEILTSEQAKRNFPHEIAARDMPLPELEALAKQLSTFFN